MKIGHISLAPATDNRFYDTVAALAGVDVQQHVIVGDVQLARRLADLPGVSVGPIVKTPVMAYCLMPQVDLAHIHETRSGQAGLLLTLTRSIPYVLTASNGEGKSKNPLTRSIFHRACKVVDADSAASVRQLANDYLSCYDDAMSSWYRTALKL